MASTDRFSESHRWKILTIGVAANASFAAVVGGISATGVLMRAAYALNTSTLGWVLGMLGLGIAVSELPWGMLTDRWGDRPVLLTGLGTSALALIGMAAFVAPGGVAHGAIASGAIASGAVASGAVTYGAATGAIASIGAEHTAIPPAWLLAGALCLVGLLGSSVNGSSGRAIMSWFRVQERGLAMSIRQTAVPLGYGLGALILPALAAHLGFAYVYGACALFCLISAGLAWRWLHEPTYLDAHGSAMSGLRDSSVSGSARSTGSSACASIVAAATRAASDTLSSRDDSGRHAPRNPMTDQQIWRVVLAIGILCAPQFAVITFGAVFLHDVLGIATAKSGAVLAAVQVGAMIMRVWSGRWTDRHHNRREYLHLCCMISGVTFAVLGVLAWVFASKDAVHPSSIAIVVGVLVLSGISVSAWHGVAYAELAEMAGVARAGTALAMGNMTAFTLLFVTPSCIPLLLKFHSWPAVWLAAVACAIVARGLFPGKDHAAND